MVDISEDINQIMSDEWYNPPDWFDYLIEQDIEDYIDDETSDF
tara:strand:+ start:2167 stop:2295 length:129 start_codon:yes stop_codon:yes gene_type:complete